MIGSPCDGERREWRSVVERATSISTIPLGLVTCTAGRVVVEPRDDARHVLLKAPGDGTVQRTGPSFTAIFEVVRDAGRDEDEGALRRVEPLAVDQEAHRALDDVEHVVFRVGVSAGALGTRLQPPLRDRVSVRGFNAVGLEDGGDPPHRIGPSLAGTKKNW